MDRARGVDCSHHHPVTNFAALRAAGYSFFGTKVTEGNSFTDPTFRAHLAGARSTPFTAVLLFHFARAGSARAQAARFMDTVGPLRPNETLCLDLEPRHLATTPAVDEYPTKDPKDAIEWVDEFYTELMHGACSGRRGLIYTSKRVWDAIGDPAWDLAPEVDLWVPRYSVNEPKLPSPWPSWKIWQDSSTATVPGVQGPCDRDLFDGDEAALAAWVRGTP